MTPVIKYHWMFSDFKKRFEADGGTLSQSEFYALNTWCWENDKNQLLSSYIAYYPFVGGNGTVHSIANFRHNFISSNYKLTAVNVTSGMCTSRGYQGNGTTSYWDPGINPFSVMSLNDHRLTYYCMTNSDGSEGSGALTVDMAAKDEGSNYSALFSRQGAGRLLDTFIAGDNTTSIASYTNSDSRGFRSGYRRASNYMGIALNGLEVGNKTSGMTGALPNAGILLGGYNNNGSMTSLSSRRYGSFGFSLAIPFNDKESIAYMIEQNTQTILARQI